MLEPEQGITLRRITQRIVACVVLGSLAAIAAFVHLLRTGLDGSRVFWRIMDVALLFLVIATILGMKFASVNWRNRPDKQKKLRLVKRLVFLLVVLAIPTAIMNWFWS
jgi:nitrogen fixation/metabolism regulation signal transduction histidine kinase